MDSKTYWRKRETENLKKYLKDEKAFAKELSGYYEYMLSQTQKEINSFYARYAAKEKITLAEAKRRVSAIDIKEYETKAKKYVKEKNFSDQANEEMRLYNATMRINRLEMLKANIGLELIDGHDSIQKFMDGILQGRTMEELERQAGILGGTINDNAKTAKAIVDSSFHNAKFSDRIWSNQDALRSELSKMLQTGLIQGKNPRELARGLRRTFDVSKASAERLMRTELSRVQAEAQKQSFEENGYEEYEFIAIGNDGKTCPICKELDGKHFKVKDMMPGENAPPIHPNCRCSTSSYENSDDYEKWLEFLENGGTTEEWNKLKNVANKRAEGIANLTKGRKNGIINIEIDKFVPCLEDAKTGKILDTVAKQITSKAELKGYTEKNGWFINWAKEIDAGRNVYGLYLKNDDVLQGLCSFDIEPKNYAVHGNWIVAAPHNRGENKKYNGVGGHLYAIMGEVSVKSGFDGFFYGKAANQKLLDHYIAKFNARQINAIEPYSFEINEVAMRELLNKYNFEWRED